MAEIMKREGKASVTYRVRYPRTAGKPGYAYASVQTPKEAMAFVVSERECPTSEQEKVKKG